MLPDRHSEERKRESIFDSSQSNFSTPSPFSSTSWDNQHKFPCRSAAIAIIIFFSPPPTRGTMMLSAINHLRTHRDRVLRTDRPPRRLFGTGPANVSPNHRAHSRMGVTIKPTGATSNINRLSRVERKASRSPHIRMFGLSDWAQNSAYEFDLTQATSPCSRSALREWEPDRRPHQRISAAGESRAVSKLNPEPSTADLNAAADYGKKASVREQHTYSSAGFCWARQTSASPPIARISPQHSFFYGLARPLKTPGRAASLCLWLATLQ